MRFEHVYISTSTTRRPKNVLEHGLDGCQAQPVGDVLVHGPALQPVAVLVQPQVSLGDEECAGSSCTRWTDDRHSITFRLMPPGVSTRSNDLLTLGTGQSDLAPCESQSAD